MKPFDLEAFKAGAVALTRDGRKAWFIAHVPEFAGGHQILARIEDEDEGPMTYWTSGEFYADEEHGYDLTHMTPTTKTLWQAVAKKAGDDGVYWTSNYYPSKELAERAGDAVKGAGKYTLHEITIEE